MALALDGAQLQRQASAQRVRRGNHPGARQPRYARQRLQVQPGQQRREQKQPAEARVELAWRQRELPHVGHRLGARAHAWGALLVQAPRQGGEAFGLEHFAHGGGAQRQRTLLQRLADLVDGVVGLAQFNDELTRGRELMKNCGSAVRRKWWHMTWNAPGE
jgi:hypothetical protein